MVYPTSASSTAGSTKTLASDARMSSQVDLNDEESGKRNGASSKVMSIIKCKKKNSLFYLRFFV